VLQESFRAVDHAGAELRVGEVRLRLVAPGDAVSLGHRAVAKALELREDEPHPVRALLAGAQLVKGAFVDAVGGLGVDEALQVVRVGAHAASVAHVRLVDRRSTLAPMVNQDGMRARILRGADQVGGSCVELESAGRRLVLDVGLPLGPLPAYRDLLPDVPGLWVRGDDALEGVVLSHAHGDHSGLADLIAPGVRVLAGKATVDMAQAAAFFRPGAALPLSVEPVLRDGEPVKLGPFTVTPLRLGHSAHESFALLIEAGGARLLYSGDLRIASAMDRRRAERAAMVANRVDVLLLEGTSIGRSPSGAPTEDDVTARYVELMGRTDGAVLAMLSPMNTDRLAAVYAACREARRDLVIDLYTADVLAALEPDPSLPKAGAPGVRVYLPHTQRDRVLDVQSFDGVNRVRRHRIYGEELWRRSRDLTLVARTSMLRELQRAGVTDGAVVAWSMWAGYLRGETERRLEGAGLRVEVIHASGHATPEALTDFATLVNPGKVVPIHTAAPQDFSLLTDRAEPRVDGEWWRVAVSRPGSVTAEVSR